MNVGQILETHSLGCASLVCIFSTPVFDGATKARSRRSSSRSLPSDGKGPIVTTA